MTAVEVLGADIARLEVDAIANAASSDLKHELGAFSLAPRGVRYGGGPFLR